MFIHPKTDDETMAHETNHVGARKEHVIQGTRAEQATQTKQSVQAEQAEQAAQSVQLSQTSHRSFNYVRARKIVALLFVAAIGLSLATHAGTGAYSSLGISWVSEICPVGILQSVASGNVNSAHLIIGAAIAVALILLFGRAFCAWGCPVPWITRFFIRKKNAQKVPDQIAAEFHSDNKRDRGYFKRHGIHIDSRHILLIGVVVAAIIFAFPVFCLICPVGLTAATIICYWHLIQFNDVTWGLVVFPAIIAFETIGFKKHWCTWICPIAACTSLVSLGNKIFWPKVAKNQCLRTQGIDCKECVRACPEKLDPHSNHIPDCTKCGACINACPAHAISILR